MSSLLLTFIVRTGLTALSADYMQGTRLSFRSKEDAIHFAEKQGAVHIYYLMTTLSTRRIGQDGITMCTCWYNSSLNATHRPMQPTTHSKEGSSEELRGEFLVSPWQASYYEDEIDCVDTSPNTITLYLRSQISDLSPLKRVIDEALKSRGITS